MKTKQHVHNLIILDESGSMSSIKNSVIHNFNETVQSIKGADKKHQNQEHFISFFSFNSSGIKTFHLNEGTSNLKEINADDYEPNELTPLYDTIGYSVNKVRKLIKDIDNCYVLVTILTDGLENASKEYSQLDIKTLIEELKEENWTFTYLGTDHAVEEAAEKISIRNTFYFEKSLAGLDKLSLKEINSRENYYNSISNYLSVEDGSFFETFDENIAETEEEK